MKIGELCETCGTFNEGNLKVAECPVCGNDVCDSCANDFLCPSCYARKEVWTLNATPIYEEGELVAWETNHE